MFCGGLERSFRTRMVGCLNRGRDRPTCKCDNSKKKPKIKQILPSYASDIPHMDHRYNKGESMNSGCGWIFSGAAFWLPVSPVLVGGQGAKPPESPEF